MVATIAKPCECTCQEPCPVDTSNHAVPQPGIHYCDACMQCILTENAVPDGAEVVYLVLVEECNEDGEVWFQYYETGAKLENNMNLQVMRVEIYEGRKTRILLWDGTNENGSPSITVYNFPWAKVLHWQEA